MILQDQVKTQINNFTQVANNLDDMARSSEDTTEHSSIIKSQVVITLMIWQGQVKKQLNTVL